MPLPIIPANSAADSGNQNGIFGFGYIHSPASWLAMTNIVANTGVVATDTTGVGIVRRELAGCQYGGDKGIFGYGTGPTLTPASYTSITNLVSNTGVVATDTAGVGFARGFLAACSYGDDKGIFGFGHRGGFLSMTNLVTNTGVVGTDVTGVGANRRFLGACEYGDDKGIFGYGGSPSNQNITNLVSNTGVVATDVTGVGTASQDLAACEYGGDKGIFGYGYNGSSAVGMTNLVSNAGVVATDVSVVGTARTGPAGCSFNT